jgi:N-acyl-D-amino-acid deacylase
MSDFDLVVRGGTVADGSGGELFEGDVAVRNGKIAQVGKVAGAGKEEINAKGKLVTPGFVDIHTHYDGQITWAERLQPSSGHGVTTVVMGNCGVGFAPCRPDQHDLMIRVMEGVEDIPGIVLAEGIPWKWETFPQYLDFIGSRRADVDFAAQVPHAPVRVYVMGMRGADREPAMAGDIAHMAAIVKEGVEAGALGFSTSRSILHRLKDGRLAPTITVNEDELTGIARSLREANTGVLQFIDDFNDAMAEASASLAMWRRLCQESGRPVSFNLAQNPFWEDGLSLHVLDYIAQANQDGLTMKAQVCNRPIGALFGLECSTHPFVFSPSYRSIASLPLRERVARLRSCRSPSGLRGCTIPTCASGFWPKPRPTRTCGWSNGCATSTTCTHSVIRPTTRRARRIRSARGRARPAGRRSIMSTIICWSAMARAFSTIRLPISATAISTSSIASSATRTAFRASPTAAPISA